MCWACTGLYFLKLCSLPHSFWCALFYVRQWTVPWLGGEGDKGITIAMLWPEFEAVWPVNRQP